MVDARLCHCHCFGCTVRVQRSLSLSLMRQEVVLWLLSNLACLVLKTPLLKSNCNNGELLHSI